MTGATSDETGRVSVTILVAEPEVEDIVSCPLRPPKIVVNFVWVIQGKINKESHSTGLVLVKTVNLVFQSNYCPLSQQISQPLGWGSLASS